MRTLIKRDFETCFADGIDAILTPTTPSAAFAIGEKGRGDPVEMYLNDIFTVTVNMAGLPGISVPSGLDAQGLPLGLQMVGRPFQEETLFALGAVIEQAAEFSGRNAGGELTQVGFTGFIVHVRSEAPGVRWLWPRRSRHPHSAGAAAPSDIRAEGNRSASRARRNADPRAPKRCRR